MMAAIAAQLVAASAVPMIAVGFADPAAARMPTAVAGMSCTELVLIARKVHIAFVAMPGCGFSRSSRCIARNPSAVAALPRPSMFAAIFITIAPMAGSPAGISGKSSRSTGRNARASTCTSPDFSASRMIPSHRAMMPMSGSATDITPVFAASKAPSVSSFKCPVAPPINTAARISPSQM